MISPTLTFVLLSSPAVIGTTPGQTDTVAADPIELAAGEAGQEGEEEVVRTEYWAGHQVTFGTREVPVLGTLQTRMDTFVIARVRRTSSEIQIDERACFDMIALEKDVDGVTCLGFGRMAMGEPAYGCATPQGIMRLLAHYEINLEGLHAVVIGRSPILGKPMAMMMLEANATVTICHSRTRDLESHVRQADLVVGAVGRPEFIRADWIKDGAVVVDAGYHPGGVGDIELGPLAERASAITPVPGGVGPMTINTLIQQTVESGEKALG